MQADTNMLPGRGSLVITCSECPRQFRVFPSFLRTRPEPTCSRVCRNTKWTRQARERNARICVVCGTLIYDSPSAFEKEGRKTCGLKCRAVWQTGRKLADPESPIIRFAQKVIVQDDCWGWRGQGFHSGGYGMFFDGVRNIGAHRFAWELVTGEKLTDEDVIGHTCDNPPCTRNDDEGWYDVAGIQLPRRGHLFKGTDADNSRDMWQKGRQNPTALKGEAHPGAKLTEALVLNIRADLDAGADPVILAQQHEVTSALIRAIGKRKVWRHVE